MARSEDISVLVVESMSQRIASWFRTLQNTLIIAEVTNCRARVGARHRISTSRDEMRGQTTE